MTRSSNPTLKALAGVLAGAALLWTLPAGAGERRAPEPAPARAPAAAPHKPATHRSLKLSTKARERFRAAWGVDALKVRSVASGSLIRFDFRVRDPAQAGPLVDKGATPALWVPRARAMLSVPVMDKVGPLRQTGALKAGQDYWVTFSNKGNLVRSGDRVDVIIGRFHADGLMVE
jgi:hypothetical protein